MAKSAAARFTDFNREDRSMRGISVSPGGRDLAVPAARRGGADNLPPSLTLRVVTGCAIIEIGAANKDNALLPTVRFDPLRMALELAMMSAPAATIVPWLYVFAPESLSVP